MNGLEMPAFPAHFPEGCPNQGEGKSVVGVLRRHLYTMSCSDHLLQYAVDGLFREVFRWNFRGAFADNGKEAGSAVFVKISGRKHGGVENYGAEGAVA